MQDIPLQNVPSRPYSVVLGNQNCQINLYQKPQGLFFDLNSNGADIVTGVLCHNADPLVCIKYTGFQGNLVFVDTQGTSDPAYDATGVGGLGTRYTLVYLTAAEAALINA